MLIDPTNTVPRKNKLRFVTDRHDLDIRFSDPTDEHSFEVDVYRNGELVFTGTEPAWRQLALGVGETMTYIWTARSVVVVPADFHTIEILRLNEDILDVYQSGHNHLLVCETAIVLVDADHEIDRFELAGVVTSCTRSDSGVEVSTDYGGKYLVALGGALVVEPHGGLTS